MKLIKIVFSKLFAFYLMWYGVFDIFLTLLLCSFFKDTGICVVLATIQIIDTITWYRNVLKARADNVYLFGNISQNNLLAIYGGIGTGKSTLANYILNKYCKNDDLKYYNYYKKGFKCFTHDYLFLKKALPDGAGVLIDEAGRTYDSFNGSYGKSKDKERARILAYNKFFRQFYTDQAICIYVDQCEDNLNTSLRKTVFYVIQCKGLQKCGMPLLLGGIYGWLNFIFKWTKFNIFSIVDIDYLDFNKLGEYAEHYSVNYDAKDVKHFVRPAFELFKGNDTYVFKKYNPCVYDPVEDYTWGDDESLDDEMMDKNFDLSAFNDEMMYKPFDSSNYQKILDEKFDLSSFNEEMKN